MRLTDFMAVTRTEEFNSSSNIDAFANNDDLEYQFDNSVSGIVKAIHWPKPRIALKLAAYSMCASAIIGIVLAFFDFGITQMLSLLF